MMVIGITGPTGAGKTTALMELEKLGCRVVDADAVYHQLLEGDFTLRKELEARFGPMTDETGRFDRKRLGTVVFHDPQAMAGLNAITHRHIDEALRKRLAWAEEEGCPAAAIDAIRLLESGTARLCHATLAILAPPEVRIQRIMAREGISREYAQSRVAAQRPDAFYTQNCDYTLVNDCKSAQEFAARARALFEDILNQSIF